MDKTETSKNKISLFFREIADDRLTVRDTKQIAANLKSNMLFLISGIAFAIDHRGEDSTGLISALISITFITLFASQASKLREHIKNEPIIIKIFSLLAALSVCFCTVWLENVFTCIRNDILGGRILRLFSEDFIYICFLILPTISVYFVYICMVLFWKKLTSLFSENRIFSDITSPEIILYTICILASCALVIFAFSRSTAFYNIRTTSADTVYTSDTPWVLYFKTYQNPEGNGIKHPLLALFASPFISPVYFISSILRIPDAAMYTAVTAIQTPIFACSNFLLAKAIDLTPQKRVCFMLLSFCVYSYMLFSVMAEQYIISYFWLSLFIYFLCRNKRAGAFMTCAAGGTILTSLALVPYDIYLNYNKKFLPLLRELVKQGITFIAIILAFGKIDVLIMFSEISDFSGQNLSFSDKIFQYIVFIKNYFVSPESAAIPNIHTPECLSWQLAPAEHLNIAGLIILIFCAVSFLINRKKTISKISAFWICFSFFITVIIGWGTAENGLILYSIYFGWAFFVLLFQLAERICEKFKCKFILPVLSVGTSVYLLAVNIPGIMDMINFLAENYPPQM